MWARTPQPESFPSCALYFFHYTIAPHCSNPSTHNFDLPATMPQRSSRTGHPASPPPWARIYSHSIPVSNSSVPRVLARCLGRLNVGCNVCAARLPFSISNVTAGERCLRKYRRCCLVVLQGSEEMPMRSSDLRCARGRSSASQTPTLPHPHFASSFGG